MVGTGRTRVSRLARPAAGTGLHDLDGSEHVPSDVRIRNRIQGVGSDEPVTDEGAAIAELARASKIVFSTALQPRLSWPNTRLISGDAVEEVAAMKQDGTGPMRTLGSLMLCRSLLEAGLVDRFRVVVFPVIIGSTGRDRIYDGYPDVTLEMVASRTFDGRLQLLEYVPTVLTGPPGSHPAS
jgi:dihydrofolate reductase